MAIHAKPKYGYAVNSDEWKDNISAYWAYCHSLGYTVQAFSGMFGNAQPESGQNPWRYQDDLITGGGYGLFQYTPKSGYLSEGGYGYGYSYFAPNLSVDEVTSGALPTDAYCQIDAIPRSLKYSGGDRRDAWLANWITGYNDYDTLDEFKTCTDVQKATYLWLGYFEVPGWWQTQTNVQGTGSDGHFLERYNAAVEIYKLVKDDTDPDIPDIPTPEPPTPTPTDTHRMKWIYYMGRRWIL